MNRLPAILLIFVCFANVSFAAGGGGGAKSNYLSLDPAFVVNIRGAKQNYFLQVTSEVRLSSPELAETVKHHSPAIRHAMIMLLSGLTAEEVSTLEGKESLREKAVELLQGVLEEVIDEPGIENIYFTSFIVQ
ncbi:MAG: hypothetical protein GXP08_08585 [Gammaproteobacteria bacterium]|nr:hypothetical protein [Gammaproteobacteria bacterium]